MKLSQVLEQLATHLEKHGDLEVISHGFAVKALKLTEVVVLLDGANLFESEDFPTKDVIEVL